MVTESDFDAKTSQIVLINAIYFKGRWQNEFKAYNTKDANFYMTPDKIKKAKMMKLGPKYCRYSETEEFQFLSLPYMNSDLSMKIILPKKKFQLADVIANLTAEKLMEHLMKQRGVEVIVKIPKFDIKTKFDATLPLQSMGIKDLFEKDSNLEGMTDIKPTWLSSVLHSAFICIDEEGTEAGAITAGDLRGCGLGDSPPPKPIKFKADHPFIYLITDEQNNIYFCGTITGAEFVDNGEIPPPIKEKLFKNPVTGFVKKLFEKKF
uniref:Serpin domain-containing protein n=1 Tax=Panagrolaimus davidi TaxID=227884 RepID=A0A914QAN5_9BILA